MNKNKMIVAAGIGMSEHMKNSMRSALIGIGVMVVVSLVAWLAYEVTAIRQEVVRGFSWMASFL